MSEHLYIGDSNAGGFGLADGGPWWQFGPPMDTWHNVGYVWDPALGVWVDPSGGHHLSDVQSLGNPRDNPLKLYVFSGQDQTSRPWVSADGGNTWARRNTIPAGPEADQSWANLCSPQDGLVFAMSNALDPTNSSLLAPANCGIFRSLDDGNTWTQLTTGTAITDYYGVCALGFLAASASWLWWGELVDYNFYGSAPGAHAYTWAIRRCRFDGSFLQTLPGTIVTSENIRVLMPWPYDDNLCLVTSFAISDAWKATPTGGLVGICPPPLYSVGIETGGTWTGIGPWGASAVSASTFVIIGTYNTSFVWGEDMYVFRSTDAGATWTQTMDVPTNLACTGPGGIRSDQGMPISQSLTTRNHLSMMGAYDPQNVWLSRDGGVSWTSYVNLADPLRVDDPAHYVSIYANGIWGFAEPPAAVAVPSRLATIVG